MLPAHNSKQCFHIPVSCVLYSCTLKSNMAHAEVLNSLTQAELENLGLLVLKQKANMSFKNLSQKQIAS